jgi:hypothetical protein
MEWIRESIYRSNTLLDSGFQRKGWLEKVRNSHFFLTFLERPTKVVRSPQRQLNVVLPRTGNSICDLCAHSRHLTQQSRITQTTSLKSQRHLYVDLLMTNLQLSLTLKMKKNLLIISEQTPYMRLKSGSQFFTKVKKSGNYRVNVFQRRIKL